MSERSVRFGIVKHISHDHIRSAIHLAKLTLSTEENFKAKPHDGIPYYSHRAYAIGTILFEPDVQWQDDEHKFMKKFKNKKIAANPLTADLNRTEFPDTLLSYSYTKWAIQSSIKFVVEFDTRIGLISTFGEFEN